MKRALPRLRLPRADRRGGVHSDLDRHRAITDPQERASAKLANRLQSTRNQTGRSLRTTLALVGLKSRVFREGLGAGVAADY